MNYKVNRELLEQWLDFRASLEDLSNQENFEGRNYPSVLTIGDLQSLGKSRGDEFMFVTKTLVALESLEESFKEKSMIHHTIRPYHKGDKEWVYKDFIFDPNSLESEPDKWEYLQQNKIIEEVLSPMKKLIEFIEENDNDYEDHEEVDIPLPFPYALCDPDKFIEFKILVDEADEDRKKAETKWSNRHRIIHNRCKSLVTLFLSISTEGQELMMVVNGHKKEQNEETIIVPERDTFNSNAE